MRLIAPALALLLMTGPLAAQEADPEDHTAEEMPEDDHAEREDHADEDADHLAELEGLRLLHAWTNATDGDTTQVYVTIENMGDAEVYLTGAATGIAEAARLVAQPMEADGDPEQIGTLPLPAGSEMDLEPGGVFIELTGLTETLVEGGEFEVIVTLDPLGEVEVHVSVEAEDARQHSHAGHAH